MRIQHNIPAMSAYRNYTNNVAAMKKNLEKLSSGYKINRAGDDAAGLAISEKMRAQITGLQTAQKNAKDGISLVQTAEGALTEVHDMLNRMVELASMSANGTYDNTTDRKQLQKEMDQLRSEINRIADSANFNGIKLLDGTQAAESANPLGEAAELVESLDGTAATPGGKAVISFDTTSPNNQPDPIKGEVDSVTNGLKMDQAGVKAEITLKMGAGGTADGAVTITSKWAGTDGTSDLSGTLQDGDTVTLSNGTYTKTYNFDATATAADATKFTTLADLATKAAADGFVLNTGTANAVTGTVKASVMEGFFNGATAATITNTTNVADIGNLSLTANGPKLSDQYDIVVKDSTGAAVTTGTMDNGYTIELTAKYGGEIAANTFDNVKEATSTNIAGNSAAKATIVNAGKDEASGAAPAPSGAIYELKFDFDKLSVGQSFSIGDKTIYFSDDDGKLADGTTAPTGTTVINLNKITDAAGSTADIYDDIANEINKALTDATNGAFKDVFTGTVEADTTDTDGKTFTISLSAKDNTITSDKVNLGAVRLSANTAHSGLIDPTYAPMEDSSVTPPADSTDQFATVTYKNVDLTKLTAGSSITIGGKTVNVVGSNYTGDTGVITAADGSKSYTLKLAGGATSASAVDLTNAFEQIGFDKGQLSFGTGANVGKLTIKGTTVGQTGAALKTALGADAVSIKQAPVAAKEIDIGGAKIKIGTTDLKDLLDLEITVGSGTNAQTFNLGDAFDIKVDDTAVTSTSTGQVEGNQKITLTAKNNGKLSQDVLDALQPKEGNTAISVTQTNGYDEGENPAGMKTEYGLTIDLSKAAGGNAFTFGNANGNSITFELSYDAVGTNNGTVDSSNYVDVAENGDKRVQINLFGKSEAGAAKAIADAVGDATNGIGGKFDVTATAVSSHKFTLNIIGKEDYNEATNDTNWGQVRFSNSASGTGNSDGVFTSNKYVPAGGVASSSAGTYAQIAYNFDPAKIKAGDALTIGDKTIYFGDADKTETVDGKLKITVNAEGLGDDPSKIVSAFERAGYTTGQLKIADGKLTITDSVKVGGSAKDLADKNKVSLKRELAQGSDGMQGGLVLQIGDTAEAFNQLRVSIQDMHTGSLGLDKISIEDQNDAASAIDAIKAAINTVSDVRGTLGATQNRLDHTINNLSVMTENIQDAESTIRDTDVAEEMMEYTKNNILIQSAQAMLAQANQMPQGVLQLLQ